MIILVWLGVLAGLTWAFGLWDQRQDNPNMRPVSYSSEALREVQLEQNRQGHYLATGEINGTRAIFILDTGATDVVVSQDLADSIGLRRGQPHIAQTANGRVRVYATRLDRLQLGSIDLRDVRASINPAMTGEHVLLGMSALKQVEFTQRGTTLTLRQHLDD